MVVEAIVCIPTEDGWEREKGDEIMEYSLAWIIGKKENSFGGHKHGIIFDEVLEKLDKIISINIGFIGLNKLDSGYERGAYNLQISYENDCFYMSMNEVTQDDEDVVRLYECGELFDENMNIKDDIEIRGYEYIADSLTTDVNLVKQVLKEFYETGNVSYDILEY